MIASIYGVWLVYAAGLEYLLLTMTLYAPGIFYFFTMFKKQKEFEANIYSSGISIIRSNWCFSILCDLWINYRQYYFIKRCESEINWRAGIWHEEKIVVALGGNAIQSGEATAGAQQEALEKTAEQLVKIMENDVDIVIAHGNGPQVGNILLQQKAAETEKTPAMPLDTCGAMSQGMIGYWMENAIEKALKKRNINKDVATVITRVVVDKKR